MLHRLTVGHLDRAAVERRQAVPAKALEMDVVHRLLAELGEKDAEGNVTLGGCRVEFHNAAVSCLWNSSHTNHVAEEFGLRMQRETGCVIADVGGYRVIEPGELAGLNGQAVTAQKTPAGKSNCHRFLPRRNNLFRPTVPGRTMLGYGHRHSTISGT